MESVGTKKTIVHIFAIATGLITFLALIFPLCVSIDDGGGYYFTESWVENGFTFLGFNSYLCSGRRYAFANVIIGLVCYAMVICWVVSTVLTLMTMFTSKKFDKIIFGFVSACPACVFLYMLAGIIMSSISSGFWDFSYTLAFIPFILVVGIYTAYLIFYRKSKLSRVASQPNANNGEPTYVAMNFEEQKQKAQEEGVKIGAKYSIKGAVGKSLDVYENKCVITTKTTFRSVIAGNFTDGEKTIYYADLVGVQFRPCSAVLLGYLQFETASTQSNRKGGAWASNYESENAFTFEASINELMEEVSNYVKKRLEEIKENKANGNAGVVASQTSVADELLKFKNLLDAGVISQEEFDKKKAELLK